MARGRDVSAAEKGREQEWRGGREERGEISPVLEEASHNHVLSDGTKTTSPDPFLGPESWGCDKESSSHSRPL